MTEAEEPDRSALDPYLHHYPHNPVHHPSVHDDNNNHHPHDQLNLLDQNGMDSDVNQNTPRSLSGAEAYHRFLWHNKHVLYELKLSVIVLLGGIIVLACVIYIVLQCRARVRPAGSTHRLSHSSSASSSDSGQQQQQHHNHYCYQARSNRRDDEKELFGSNETLENLIPSEKNSIRLKVRRDQEFFV